MAKNLRSKVQKENLLAELLEGFAKASGIDIGELLADTFTEAAAERKIVKEKKRKPKKQKPGKKRGRYTEREVYEEETEDEPIDLKNPDGNKTKDYMHDLFQYEGVSWDEKISDEVRDSP